MTYRNGLVSCLSTWFLGLIFALLLALFTLPARAVFQGVAGEALLIPVALYDPAYGVNTIVEITVPDQVGKAALSNQFTAQHTSPADEPLEGGSEVTVHWSFFNSQGWIRAHGHLTTLPNSRLMLNWGSLVSQTLPHLPGELGYLVIQTENGANGEEADFNFFGHARMTFGERSASIPVIALSDDQDDLQANPLPTLGNEVIGMTPQSPRLLAPLAAGMRTGSVDAGPHSYTVFDLVVGKRYWTLEYGYFPFSAYWRRVNEPTLLVVWNDRNNPNWHPAASFFYDTNAEHCSFLLPLGRALNVYWVSPPGVPSFGPGYIDTVTPCSPSGSWFSSPAYVHVVVPSAQQDAAGVAFSIVFSDDQAHMTFARERGRFDAP